MLQSDSVLPFTDPVRDSHGRPFLNLRISVTQNCNLECPYCHREGQLPSKEEMTPAEIARISRIAGELGVRSIKLTGGEPLSRKDIVDIIRLIHEASPTVEISMVTNGTLLKAQLASRLKENGLVRANINIPSVEKRTYESLTGGKLQDALSGVEAAVSAGLFPVKVNMLLLAGINNDQVDLMLDFCRKTGVTLQIIELEPLNLDMEYYSRHHLSLGDIERRLSLEAKKVEVRQSMHGRKVYHLRGTKVEIVRPVENTEFCLRCSRMRLTSDGKLKSCLMRSDDLVNLLSSMRSWADDDKLRDLIVASAKTRRPFYGAKSL